MWKAVVLFAVLGVAAAEPGAVFASPLVAPLAYSSAVLAPATTTITATVHPSPYLTYSAPYFAHYIKKRSAPLLAAPYFASGLTYTSPFLHTTYAAPAVLPAPLFTDAPFAYPHLIKKRSAPILTTPYIRTASIAYTPFVNYPYTAQVLPAGRIYTPGLYGHPHVIKKRTLQLVAGVFRWLFSSGQNNRGGGGGRNNNW